MGATFPHLTEVESVRQEAAGQYGGLQDAAAFQEAHRASLSPDVEAASLRRINQGETDKVQADLSLAQDKIDAEYGEGAYRVLDAVVRGDALSVIAEDHYGRPQHVVVGWTNRWRSIVPDNADARANAEAESRRGLLGAEARAEVARQVEEARVQIMEEVSKKFAQASDKVTEARDQKLDEVAEHREQQASEESGAAASSGSRRKPGARKPRARKPGARKPGARAPRSRPSRAEGE